MLFRSRACNSLQGFVTLINELGASIADLALKDVIPLVLTRTALRDFFRKEKGEKAQTRLENLDELINAAALFVADDDAENTGSPTSPLQQFIDTAALNAGDGQADEFEDAVQLMTLHSAKGLEFHAVFMVGVEENLFPHKMSSDDPVRLEEERRLCYVGITRARQRLFMSYAETRRLHGSETFNRPSRFIRELPQECVHEVRLRTQVTRPLTQVPYTMTQTQKKPAPALRQPSTRQPLIPSEGGFRLGQRVTHAKFGDGVVLQFEGREASARVQVNFQQDGTKWLVLQYANLQAV